MSRSGNMIDVNEIGSAHDEIIVKEQAFSNTNNIFKNESIDIVFSHIEHDVDDEADRNIMATGKGLSNKVLDCLIEWFPNEFMKCSASYSIEQKNYTKNDYITIKKITPPNDLNEELKPAHVDLVSRQKQFIKALAGSRLIAKIVDSDSALAPKDGPLFKVIKDLIDKISGNDLVSLSEAFNDYRFFETFTDDYLAGNLQNYFLDLTQEDVEEKENCVKLKTLFPGLKFYRYQVFGQNKPNFMIKKEDSNTDYFDKLRPTRLFIQKLTSTRKIYEDKVKKQAGSEKVKALGEMLTSFESLAKTISADNDMNAQETAAVYRYFTEPLDAVIGNRPINWKQVVKAEEKMNLIFHGRPPVNAATSTAIAAATGGMVTFAATFLSLGALAMIASTGGGALIPVGVVILSLLALEVAGFTGFLSGGKGYSSAKKKEKEFYNTQKKNRFESHKTEYNKAIDGLETFFSKPKPKINKPAYVAVAGLPSNYQAPK